MTPRRALDRRDLLVLVAILAVAALVRLPGIDGRGMFDDDQGTHLLALRAWVDGGEVPLLGPSSSLGGLHHGALYYWLLAPVAALSAVDPTAIVLAIAAWGIVGVAATWGLARTVGGAAAGHAAGLLAALSPAWVESSTFIWNPSLVAPAASIAVLGAWRARTGGNAAWWVVAAAGATLLVHAHLVSAVLLAPLLWLAATDARRRRTEGRPLGRGVAAGVAAVAVAGLLPFLVHELTHDGAELRALAAFLSSPGDGGGGGTLPANLAIIAWRSLESPVAGVVTAMPLVAGIVALAVVLALAWRWLAGDEPERGFVRWSGMTIVLGVVALAFVAPGLATVTPGLPNDHYHAFLDPLVLAALGLAIGALWRAGGAAPAAMRGGGAAPLLWRVAAIAGLAALGAVALVAQPAGRSPNGWPDLAAAAARVTAGVGDAPVAVEALPEVKPGDAVAFGLVRAGARVVAPGEAAVIVIVCDPLFEDVLRARCGGPAEDAWLAAQGRPWRLAERFEAGPRRVLSVYREAGSS